MTETTAEPVTLVVQRRVKAGKEADYERWLAGLIEQTSTLPGYLGTTVERPAPGEVPEYTTIYRFASVEALRRFERSPLRRRAVAEVHDLVEADPIWQTLTGYEVWFTAPPGTVHPQPSRFRMALLVIAVVYTLILLIGALSAPVLGDLPFPVRLLITLSVEVFFMTYVLMPWLTRKLARFIYPRH